MQKCSFLLLLENKEEETYNTISSDCVSHPIGKQEIVYMAVAVSAHGGLSGAYL